MFTNRRVDRPQENRMSSKLFATLLLVTTVTLVTSQSNGSTANLSSYPQLEILRGRDGRDGRDGMPGPPGEKGSQGSRGLTGSRGARGLVGPPGPRSGGVTYVRWGKSSCPNVAGTQPLYAGRAAGNFFSKQGGGGNYLCMPEVPEYSATLRYRTGSQKYSEIFGVEYELPIVGTLDHNVPCAVCSASTRVSVVMIPARASCPTGWTREYYGYLMTQASIHTNQYRTPFECVDKDQDSVPWSQANTGGALFYHVEVNCNGLPCPPYNNHKELNCVVCTK